MTNVFEKCIPNDATYESCETDSGVTLGLKTVVKETSKLHKALADVIFPEEIEVSISISIYVYCIDVCYGSF